MDQAEARAGVAASDERSAAPTSLRFVAAIAAGWVALIGTCAIIYLVLDFVFSRPPSLSWFLDDFVRDFGGTLRDFIKEAGLPALAVSAAAGLGMHYWLSHRGWEHRRGSYTMAGALLGSLGMSAFALSELPHDLAFIPFLALLGALIGAVYAAAFGEVMRRR